MQDNFKQFLEYTKLEMGVDPNLADCFYNVSVIRRGKDGHKHCGNSSNRTIKTYFIKNDIELEKYRDEIITMCEAFHARAYIDPQPRHWSNYALELNLEIARRMANNSFEKLHRTAMSAATKCKRYERYWLLDIDDPQDLMSVRAWCEELGPSWRVNKKNATKLLPEGEYPGFPNTTIHMEVKTNSGYHLIVNPFESIVDDFKAKFPQVEIKENNATLLYYPVSLS